MVEDGIYVNCHRHSRGTKDTFPILRIKFTAAKSPSAARANSACHENRFARVLEAK